MNTKHKICPCCKSSNVLLLETFTQQASFEKLNKHDYTDELEKNELELSTKLTTDEINLMLAHQNSFGRYCICKDCGFHFLESTDFSKTDFETLTIISKEKYLKKFSEALEMFMPNTENTKLIKKSFYDRAATGKVFYLETLNTILRSIINNNLNYANYTAVERIQKQIEYYKWMDSEKKKSDACGTYDFCKYCDKTIKNPCANAVDKIRIALNEEPFRIK